MIKIGNKQYATIKEYADKQMVTVQTVYNWIKNDIVKTKKMFNQTLIEI